MRCPRCGHEIENPGGACARCGVPYRDRLSASVRHALPPGSPVLAWFTERAFQVEPEAGTGILAARAALWVILAVWGLRILALPLSGPDLAGSFLHWIHLPFHEAGHVLFSPFGEFLHILGGTLGQLLVPLGVLLVFLRQRDPFAASAGCWWLGSSFIDCAPYIHDARSRTLLLISGATGQEDWEGHDWFQLLNRTGLLAWDHTLARLSWLCGALLLLAGLAWGGFVLWRQRQTR